MERRDIIGILMGCLGGGRGEGNRIRKWDVGESGLPIKVERVAEWGIVRWGEFFF